MSGLAGLYFGHHVTPNETGHGISELLQNVLQLPDPAMEKINNDLPPPDETSEDNKTSEDDDQSSQGLTPSKPQAPVREEKDLEMKSELSVLMERLKVQMDDLESQNETLRAVKSICQENSDLCKYFVDMGGLRLLYNLAKSSSHSRVKGASLYTLAVLARSNVYCQQILSTAEFFGYICTYLSDEGSSVNLKRISVFLILVLVSNNKTGQNLARELGCIETLLFLFSKILISNVVLVSGSTNPEYQLWSSVCSALGACATNPQNEENQKVCSSAFPQAIKWLHDSLQHEIVRPICCMIRPIVANSRFVQDYFASIGGLEILADILSHLVNGLQERSLDFRLALVVTETLDTCITENSEAIRHLENHSIISSLMSLLSCGNLEEKYKLSIVRTIGHLTEDCEANQYELLKSHGLSLMDQILEESQDDKLQKAARFFLQNCIPISPTSPSTRRFEEIAEVRHKRIQKLEQENNEALENIQQLVPPGFHREVQHQKSHYFSKPITYCFAD
ncbi:telomere repeats-binding bouquet formation protein 1-like [Anomaloglossus baeobatrachus]|uniref:telomere repeats-binding bouquet formation protein 1-like n=1 Tax=Anomaloglossus baeobatrachus TaxID=238106 RepID=UPI003F505880